MTMIDFTMKCFEDYETCVEECEKDMCFSTPLIVECRKRCQEICSHDNCYKVYRRGT